MNALYQAAKVIVTTPAINAWLQEHDPKALEQLERALQGQSQQPRSSTTHDERYFHLQRKEVVGKVLGEYVLRPVWYTLFARKDRAAAGEDLQWYVTAARCSPRDQFERKKGRTVARLRFFQQCNEQWDPKDAKVGFSVADAKAFLESRRMP